MAPGMRDSVLMLFQDVFDERSVGGELAGADGTVIDLVGLEIVDEELVVAYLCYGRSDLIARAVGIVGDGGRGGGERQADAEEEADGEVSQVAHDELLRVRDVEVMGLRLAGRGVVLQIILPGDRTGSSAGNKAVWGWF